MLGKFKRYVYNMYMAQININTDPEFSRDLAILMKAMGEKHKSSLFRRLVREALESLGIKKKRRDFSSLIGAASASPQSPKPLTEDDLW